MSKPPLIIYNPECSKCQWVKGAMEQVCEIQTVQYLDGELTEDLLREVMRLSGKKASELLRVSEPLFQKQYAGKNFSDEEWIRIILDNPVLLQRPIVIYENSAQITRDEDTLKSLLNKLNSEK